MSADFEFEPRPGMHCARCPFVHGCPDADRIELADLEVPVISRSERRRARCLAHRRPQMLTPTATEADAVPRSHYWLGAFNLPLLLYHVLAVLPPDTPAEQNAADLVYASLQPLAPIRCDLREEEVRSRGQPSAPDEPTSTPQPGSRGRSFAP